VDVTYSTAPSPTSDNDNLPRLPADWIGELEKRGIVRRDILREQAREVFLRYRELGGDGY
jgi:hypothetical protein